ncbi:hypothetical protein COR50_10275 [Chitinophaga caeni]|uniref:Uncharacterized protein n=1 Tax=Chitinophaga caeni TaxID=2029983 RepID=A0A291QUC7_9BACT|nr:hypothetical protein [Chitinophaga caeni]ATL47521.1 hypothetical protein COR50_10275 [Chitinophaga caeni]
MVRIAIVLSLIICWGCKQQSKRKLSVTDQFSAMVPDSAGHIYFAQDTSHFDFTEWSSDVLYRLQEPDFSGYKGNGDFIRFVWLRSFENPVVVRINRFSDTVYANIKELGRREEKLSIIRDTLIMLEPENWRQFSNPLEQYRFWDSSPEPVSEAMDGATWYLESKSGEKYKVIEGWDSGGLSSESLRNYLDPLIKFAERYVRLRTAKGR